MKKKFLAVITFSMLAGSVFAMPNFDSLDADKDGSLSKSEFDAGMSSMGSMDSGSMGAMGSDQGMSSQDDSKSGSAGMSGAGQLPEPGSEMHEGVTSGSPGPANRVPGVSESATAHQPAPQ